MRKLILVVHNVRSAHNVGSLLRTADGLGIDSVVLSGYTPYPLSRSDTRLPHISAKVSARIAKTALGAERLVSWRHDSDINNVITELRGRDFYVAVLEQDPKSRDLKDFKLDGDIALIVGSEVGGLDKRVVRAADAAVEIPMAGGKESLNVAVAAAIALYQIKNQV